MKGKALKGGTAYTKDLYRKEDEHGTLQGNKGKMRLKRYPGRSLGTILKLTLTMLQVLFFPNGTGFNTF